jgi:hydroxymethylpyrimidine pyrophosphatase-like HAD family hydrolase
MAPPESPQPYPAMTTVPRYLTGKKEEIKEFLDKFDVFLFDCDGVLWSGDHLFPGTVETLEMLRSNGKQVVFVTNNSTKSRADYKKKLEKLGIPSTTVRLQGKACGDWARVEGRVHGARLTGENRKKSFPHRTAHPFIFLVSSNCQRISERFSSSERRALSKSFKQRTFHSLEVQIPRIVAK